MNWSKEKEQAAHTSNSDSGNWCIFVPLSDAEGVKFYETEAIRDAAAELQANAAQYGLAPQVGQDCEMPLLESWDKPLRWSRGVDTVYGYITERIDPGGLDDDEYHTLFEMLQEHDISTRDICASMNVGKTADGMAVRFDFDPVFYHHV